MIKVRVPSKYVVTCNGCLNDLSFGMEDVIKDSDMSSFTRGNVTTMHRAFITCPVCGYKIYSVYGENNYPFEKNTIEYKDVDWNNIPER